MHQHERRCNETQITGKYLIQILSSPEAPVCSPSACEYTSITILVWQLGVLVSPFLLDEHKSDKHLKHLVNK
jgi:hypothetical protein